MIDLFTGIWRTRIIQSNSQKSRWFAALFVAVLVLLIGLYLYPNDVGWHAPIGTFNWEPPSADVTGISDKQIFTYTRPAVSRLTPGDPLTLGLHWATKTVHLPGNPPGGIVCDRASLTNLTYLGIGGPISDQGVLKLRSLENLEKLSLYHTKVSEEGVQRLKEKRPSLRVSR